MALSLVKRFPHLVTEKQIIAKNNHPSLPPVHDTCGLESIILRPFAFHSGSKLTWWQQKIYSLTKVDMDSTYNSDTQADEQNTTKCLKGTEGDVENPQEHPKGNQIGENNPLKSSNVNS
ncbi:hypothetical protein MKW94_011411, partial [Papaver nudicaule]|nr:hypothetical protein [Papaver nudicaule]